MDERDRKGDAPGRILIVDDDPVIRSAFSRVLERQGHEVRLAEAAAPALEVLRSEQFDAVLCDVKMPEISGIELLRTLREAGDPIPVVLMTGHAQLDAAIEAVGLGALDFVRKPVEIDRLIATMTRALARGREERRMREAGARLAAESLERARLSEALDSALQGLWVATQPIVAASTGAPVGFEALMRTSAAELAGPGPMLDAAERLGRLVELGRAVRSRVAEGQREAPAGSLLFVNLHPRDLLDEELFRPDSPFARVAWHIVLEITERSSLDAIPDLERRLKDLRALGFRVAVDDLGAGYAGLSSLAELQPDVVKVDASLVRGVERDERKRRLLAALVDFCHSHGIKVVAEGVEHRAERDALVELGCDWLQGYFFARPGPGFPAPAPAA